MSVIVSSWNEWDPLKHVIVGRADDCHIPPEEPALEAKVPEDSDMRGQWGRRPQKKQSTVPMNCSMALRRHWKIGV